MRAPNYIELLFMDKRHQMTGGISRNPATYLPPSPSIFLKSSWPLVDFEADAAAAFVEEEEENSAAWTVWAGACAGLTNPRPARGLDPPVFRGTNIPPVFGGGPALREDPSLPSSDKANVFPSKTMGSGLKSNLPASCNDDEYIGQSVSKRLYAYCWCFELDDCLILVAEELHAAY